MTGAAAGALAGAALLGAVACGTGHDAGAGHGDGTGAGPGAAGQTEPRTEPQTRSYYIAAEEVTWDYVPAGSDLIAGEPFGEDAEVFVDAGPDRIGSTYPKCVYQGYTDATFTQWIERAAEDEYLGLLGPVIRAEVGDTLSVTFRNNCSFPASIHPHGVFYEKRHEGAPYDDDTTGADKVDDAVAPGAEYAYIWQVPERAGPSGQMDGSSMMWMYHSHVDEVVDPNSGLVGPMVVTARGQARPDATPNDVDRELFALFWVLDENATHYLDTALADLAEPPAADDEDFQESNKMHVVNGYVYGNGPMMTMRQGARVRWYVMGMGNEVDLHTPHWHGNTLVANGMRTDTVSLLPATMVTADMVPDNPGIWLFHCHVTDHIIAGMSSRYQVLPAAERPGSR